MNALRSPWLAAFGLVVVAHLVLLVTEDGPVATVTKCLIAPLLAAWVVQQRGPRVLVVALAFCFLGDLFLDLPDEFFVPGMAAFAVAHVCFVTFFVRRGAREALTRSWWIAALLAVAALGLLAWVWGGLDAGLRVPVLVYALLLSSTAATALAVDLRAGVGALLFLFSDALIAVRIADRLPADSALGGFVVMLTYSLALFFLATAIVRKEARTRELGGFDPTRPTDCWPKLPSGA